jgi:hypothetical protein
MANKQLADFVKEARRRGFGDITIKNELLNHGWPELEIEKAFASLQEKTSLKNQITLFLDDEVLTALEKRAKKNLLSVPEMIEDIIRRSTVNQKKTSSAYNEKLDDTLVGIFSRRRTGPKGKRSHQ